MLKDLKEFLLRGNVIDLAVGVIIANAFGAIVNSLITDVITPLFLNPILKAANLKQIAELKWNGIAYGNFLSAVINFLVIGTVLFFIVKSAEKAQSLAKKKEEADFVVSLKNNAPSEVAIVKELKDPSVSHKYSYNSVISAVRDRLSKRNLKLGYKKGFNQYVLSLIIDFYHIKQNEKYAYCHKIGNTEQYTYSQQFVDFIVSEIQKDPQRFVESLRRK